MRPAQKCPISQFYSDRRIFEGFVIAVLNIVEDVVNKAMKKTKNPLVNIIPKDTVV
jgi:hypothetical protein